MDGGRGPVCREACPLLPASPTLLADGTLRRQALSMCGWDRARHTLLGSRMSVSSPLAVGFVLGAVLLGFKDAEPLGCNLRCESVRLTAAGAGLRAWAARVVVL